MTHAFYCLTHHIATYKKIIMHTNQLCSSLYIICNSNGMQLQCSSATDSVQCLTSFSTDFFKIFELTNEVKECTVCVNLFQFYKIIQRLVSYRHQSLSVCIYCAECKEHVSILIGFHTENKTDTFHMKGKLFKPYNIFLNFL